MLAIERRNHILSILREDKRVVVSDLAKKFEVSEETIRRDLDKLEKEGQVVKTYGGAVMNENGLSELPFIIRKNKNVAGKQRIAALISDLVLEGDTVILDASSTAVFIAKKLKEDKKNLTLITNSIEVLLELSDAAGWKILSTGGTLSENSLALVGDQAERMLSSFHVNKAIISCKGVDGECGFSDSSDAHAAIKRRMLESAAQRIFAVDHTKFDRVSFTVISGFSGVDAVVTDKKPEERWRRAFASREVECLYPEEES